jgi:hypothetical protein
MLLAAPASAQLPGSALPASAEASGQKPGSVLVYNLYSSGATTTANHETRFSVSNSSTSTAAKLRLFLVDGATGAVADTFLCLAATQTSTFLASTLAPGTTGYAVALAVDGDGCPLAHNALIGDESVKLPTGHTATMNAIAVAALYTGTLAGCTSSSTSAVLAFDGVSYNRLPRVLSADRLRSPADGNSTELVLNRIGGNLGVGVPPLGAAEGTLFDSSGTPFPFAFTGGSAQFLSVLSNTFPLTDPVFADVLPAGEVGWMKVMATAENPILGALLNFNSNATTSATAFTGGHNLRVLSLGSTSVTMPVAVPSC